MLNEVLLDGDGEIEADVELLGERLILDEGLWELLADDETDEDALGETEELGLGEIDEDGARFVKIIHDRAASSLFAPSQVLVAVPAVVLVAVENLKPPTSASMSSVRFAHVLAVVSAAPA